jgi:glycosyltransferase involved in cell wall biosynthesis
MLVSVIIPTFERFKAVQESINSVLSQNYNNIEIIVVNDCSTDPNYKLLDDIYKNKNVTILHLPVNLRKKHNLLAAQGLTRNEGIKIAQGKYIAFLDDDDTWCDPNKLTEQINMMKKYNCLICSSNMKIGYGPYSENMLTTQTYFNQSFSLGTKLKDYVYMFQKKDIIPTNYINNSSCIIDCSLVTKIGLLDGGVNEDYRYWLKCLEHTKAIYIHKLFVYYDMGHSTGKNYT